MSVSLEVRFTKHLSVVLCTIVQRGILSAANVSVRHSLDPAVLMSQPMACLVCEKAMYHPCLEVRAKHGQHMLFFSRVPCCFYWLDNWQI